MKKVALIDFCGTVADFQTLCPYLECVLRVRSKWLAAIFCNPLIRFAYNILSRFLHHFLGIMFTEKDILLLLLKGVKKDVFVRCGKTFYAERVKPHLIPETLDILQSLKDEGCLLVIVSGGSDFYISHFAEEFGIDHCLTAEFGFEDDICTGKITSECMSKKKVEVINSFIERNGIECSFEACVTDSISDRPILDLCRKKIIISSKKHQKWVTSDMKEIVYDR